VTNNSRIVSSAAPTTHILSALSLHDALPISEAAHYLEWKDTAPVPLEQVQAELGKTSLSSQNRLVAGMLRPAHLLDIIQHFTLFPQKSGRTVKVVARYQQFRAVQRAIERLRTGKTREQDGESDRRGGIIWHTQGS